MTLSDLVVRNPYGNSNCCVYKSAVFFFQQVVLSSVFAVGLTARRRGAGWVAGHYLVLVGKVTTGTSESAVDLRGYGTRGYGTRGYGAHKGGADLQGPPE